MPEDNADERPNALLTKKDREWLTADEPLYTGKSAAQQRYRRRRSIRDRVRSSFRDFHLLANHLDAEEREKMFQDPSMEEYEGMIAALEFIYLGTRDGLRVSGHASFEPMLKQAIRHAEYDSDDRTPVWPAVEVLFEHDRIIVNKPEFADVDLEEVGEKIKKGDTGDLSRADFAAWTYYYRMKQDFDFQYPARMSEIPGTKIGTKDADRDDDP